MKTAAEYLAPYLERPEAMSGYGRIVRAIYDAYADGLRDGKAGTSAGITPGVAPAADDPTTNADRPILVTVRISYRGQRFTDTAEILLDTLPDRTSLSMLMAATTGTLAEEVFSQFCGAQNQLAEANRHERDLTSDPEPERD